MNKRIFFITICLTVVISIILGTFDYIQKETRTKKNITRQKGELIESFEIINKTTDDIDYISDNTKIKDNKKIKKDIIQTMPSGKFIYPISGMYLSGEILVKFQVENATAVEFYIRRPESLMEIYLGGSIQTKKNLWTYPWPTTSIPNADYLVYPKITNDYGQYYGSSIYITVINDIEKEEGAIQELQEQIEEKQTAIEIQEQDITKKKEKVIKGITAQVKDWIKEAEEILGDNKEKTKDEIKQEFEDIFQKVTEITEITEEVKKGLEILKKENQKEIDENIAKIRDLITKESEEGKEYKIPELEQGIKEDTNKSIKQLEDVIVKKQEVETVKAELFSEDSDDDGLPDHEEIRLGTDPFNSDSDQDGFLDGTEVVSGYDPLNSSPADKIKYEDPREVEVEVSEIFKVEKIEMVEIEEKEKKVLKIQGKAPPHSFVTIYIFSEPIIVVTKTDGNGNWEYILDKPLAEGRHTVYTTVTNNIGEIEKSSEPFEFARAGDKVMRLLEPKKAEVEVLSPVDSFNRNFIILVISTIIFALGGAFIVVGFFIKTKR